MCRYVEAVTGEKNVVLILDTSSEMARKNGLGVAKEAAEAVLGTLTSSDYFGVVSFSRDLGGTPVTFNPTMLRATISNRTNALEFVDDLGARADKDILPSFETSFAMINASTASGNIPTGCTSTIMVLLDGEETIENVTSIVSRVAELDDGLDVRVLTYAVGTGGNGADLGKQLACQSRGLWQTLDQAADVKNAMATYYEFLQLGVGTVAPVWTDSYLDAVTNRLAFTCSAPATRIDSDGHRELIGVAGYDLFLQDVK